MFLSSVLLLTALLGVTAAASAEDEGWKMSKRFHGFRYELSFARGAAGVAGDDFTDAIKEYADQHKCFGWVKETHTRQYVGEVRCTKAAGMAFQGWMERWETDSAAGTTATETKTETSAAAVRAPQLELRVYEDSKIRLHFTHFKLLDPQRDTCFIDAPHRCASSVPTTGEDAEADVDAGAGVEAGSGEL